ncbi:MAG: diguanylate cyclase [bacterium]|nr:diguanylate cyclase [bacterium]
MNNNMFEKIVAEHCNGFLVFNNLKELVYVNKQADRMFTKEGQLLVGEVIFSEYKEELEINHESIKRNVSLCVDEKAFCLTCRICSMMGYTVIEFKEQEKDEEIVPVINKILDKSGDLMYYKDATMTYQYANETYKRFLGKEVSGLIGSKDVELVPEDLLEQSKKSDQETLLRGSYTAIETRGNAFYRVMKERINGGVLCIAKNITKEIIEYKKATTDLLTGLNNRRNYESTIHSIYGEKKDEYYLVLIDLDDFRVINNRMGHPMGDECLRVLGKILKRHTKGEFYRLGGDEFVGLIKGERQTVVEVVENILDDLSEEVLYPRFTISVGIKQLDLDCDYIQNYKMADNALYKAKENGKNQYYFA